MKDGTIIGIVFMIYFAISLPIIAEHYTEKQPEIPEIKPFNCISVHQFRLWQSKYDMHVDSIAYYCVKGNKKSALRSADSVSKYTILLNF